MSVNTPYGVEAKSFLLCRVCLWYVYILVGVDFFDSNQTIHSAVCFCSLYCLITVWLSSYDEKLKKFS